MIIYERDINNEDNNFIYLLMELPFPLLFIPLCRTRLPSVSFSFFFFKFPLLFLLFQRYWWFFQLLYAWKKYFFHLFERYFHWVKNCSLTIFLFQCFKDCSAVFWHCIEKTYAVPLYVVCLFFFGCFKIFFSLSNLILVFLGIMFILFYFFLCLEFVKISWSLFYNFHPNRKYFGHYLFKYFFCLHSFFSSLF